MGAVEDRRRTMATPGEVTQLLAALRDGDGEAMDRLLPLVYSELRSIARRHLGRRRPGQTLDTTALVNEAYLKLAGSTREGWRDRTHFLSVAAIAMRQVLVDDARRRVTQKRGAGAYKVDFDETRLGIVEAQAEKLLALDQALTALAKLDERQSRVVEMRFFAGLSVAEVGEVLGVTERTVKRDWRTARAYLQHLLGGPGAG